MMFADLVDEVDFRERLQQLGADLPADADPATCIRLVQAQGVVGVEALVDALLSEPGLLQPEVKQALEAFYT